MDQTSIANAVKAAGPSKTRITPVLNEGAETGVWQIEIQAGDNWKSVANGLSKTQAENIVQQANNRLLCG